MAQVGGAIGKLRDSSAAIDALHFREDKSTLIPRYPRFSVDCSHGVSLPRPADDLLHHVMGTGRGRGSIFGAQRTQPGVGCRAPIYWLRLTAIIYVFI